MEIFLLIGAFLVIRSIEGQKTDGLNKFITIVSNGKKFMLDYETGIRFDKLRKAASSYGIRLEISSGMRTFERQSELYAEAVKKHGSDARKYVSEPGHSMHEVGKAFDLIIDGLAPSSANAEKIRSSSTFIWLEKNLGAFGLRWYNRKLEPWHLERVD